MGPLFQAMGGFKVEPYELPHFGLTPSLVRR